MEKEIGKLDYKELEKVGYETGGENRSGSFIQENDNVLLPGVSSGDVDIYSIEEALAKFPEIMEDYYGKAFERGGKDFEKKTKGGYFIRARKGKKVMLPVQACLVLKEKGFRQKVHNIIVVEEGAELYLITGCTASEASMEAYHLGLSEFFVHRNGKLNFTMIHSWREDAVVEPKSVAVVEEGGVFVSNYVCLQPVKEIKMYPTVFLDGRSSRASFNSIMLAHPGSHQDIGSRAILSGEGSSAEIISRAVSLGGTIIARGCLSGSGRDIKAHLECRGLMLSETGRIHAIPELETLYRDVDMSHEAAIGKVRKEEIEYLAGRGIPEEEAQSIIIRGFMDVEILGLPEVLRREISRVALETLSEGL